MRRYPGYVVLPLLIAGCSARVGRAGLDGSDEPGVDGSDTTQPDLSNPLPACAQCSADLHSILDCQGNVITTCPPDLGCDPSGACVPACQSADSNHSAVGCDYWAMNPPVFTQSCFAAFVANTWGTPVTVKVEYDGASLDPTTFGYLPKGGGAQLTYQGLTNATIPPGGIAILFLSQQGPNGDCPPQLNVATAAAAVTGTGTGKAFHITTSAPVSAYDIFPYGGGSSAVTSATLLLPHSVWDTNYVAITAYPQTITEDTALPWVAFVASEDNTQLTIKPVSDLVGGGGLMGGKAGVAITYTMNKGEVLKLAQADELSGSPVQSTKPVGMWGGNGCTNLPAAQIACDGMHQQIPPVKALGHEYAAVRYRNRIDGMEESPPWRIMGVVDGTQLTWDPSPPTGAPTTLSTGQLLEFNAAGPFNVKSQDADHPFYLAAHMTGCGEIGGYNSPVGCAGDPEFVNVIPQEQYLSDYVFFTDPTYPETDLVFIRTRGGDGMFADVTLDCAGALTGWRPVDSADKLEYTRFDLVRGNFEKQGNCDNGRHEAKSTAPFGLTVWGWGSKATTIMSQAVSYAYPAGAGVKAINAVTVPIQ